MKPMTPYPHIAVLRRLASHFIAALSVAAFPASGMACRGGRPLVLASDVEPIQQAPGDWIVSGAARSLTRTQWGSALVELELEAAPGSGKVPSSLHVVLPNFCKGYADLRDGGISLFQTRKYVLRKLELAKDPEEFRAEIGDPHNDLRLPFDAEIFSPVTTADLEERVSHSVKAQR